MFMTTGQESVCNDNPYSMETAMEFRGECKYQRKVRDINKSKNVCHKSNYEFQESQRNPIYENSAKSAKIAYYNS